VYICGCKRMLMPQDWINVHTHRPGEGVNIVDPCLGNVIMPGQGAVYFSLGIHPMYIDDMVEERLQKIELAAAEGKIVAVGEAGQTLLSSPSSPPPHSIPHLPLRQIPPP